MTETEMLSNQAYTYTINKLKKEQASIIDELEKFKQSVKMNLKYVQFECGTKEGNHYALSEAGKNRIEGLINICEE